MVPERAPLLMEHLSIFLQEAPAAALYVCSGGSQGSGERVWSMEHTQQRACLGNWLKTQHPVE